MTFCAVEIRHKELRKLLVNTLCCGDETQRSVEACCEHTSSHQVAHRNDLHNGMKTFLFVQSAEALYQQRLLTPESYVARKSLACKTLAPSAVAFATYTLRASAHPDTKCLFYCIGCVKHFPMQTKKSSASETLSCLYLLISTGNTFTIYLQQMYRKLP